MAGSWAGPAAGWAEVADNREGDFSRLGSSGMKRV